MIQAVDGAVLFVTGLVGMADDAARGRLHRRPRRVRGAARSAPGSGARPQGRPRHDLDSRAGRAVPGLSARPAGAAAADRGRISRDGGLARLPEVAAAAAAGRARARRRRRRSPRIWASGCAGWRRCASAAAILREPPAPGRASASRVARRSRSWSMVHADLAGDAWPSCSPPTVRRPSVGSMVAHDHAGPAAGLGRGVDAAAGAAAHRARLARSRGVPAGRSGRSAACAARRWRPR